MFQHTLSFVVGLWHNRPLLAAILAILLTQTVKIPIHYAQYGVWDRHRLLDAGGLPSSHAAGVTALVVTLAFVVGTSSPTFATAVVFAAIVMYDAGGIRRHAGEHAVLLNRIAMEMAKAGLTAKASPGPIREGERLKEILGHEPKEVIIGAFIGFVIGVLFGVHWG